MIVQIKEKGAILLPKEFLNKMHFHKGDSFELLSQEGSVVLRPVDVSPKGYIKQLEKELEALKKAIEKNSKK